MLLILLTCVTQNSKEFGASQLLISSCMLLKLLFGTKAKYKVQQASLVYVGLFFPFLLLKKIKFGLLSEDQEIRKTFLIPEENKLWYCTAIMEVTLYIDRISFALDSSHHIREKNFSWASDQDFYPTCTGGNAHQFHWSL